MQVTMFMSVENVAKSLDVSETTIKRLISAGKLSAVRVGRQLRISPDDLIKYVNQSKIEA